MFNTVDKKPIILAIETTTNLCSVALSCHDEIFEQSELGTNVHSKVLLAMVNKLLEQAKTQLHELDVVAVGKGPGSFTGLRIGIGVAQGIAYGAQKNMIGIDSLATLLAAWQSPTGSTTVIAGVDARMGELYWRQYSIENGSVQAKNQIQVCHPSEVELLGETNQVHLIGNAWQEHFDLLPEQIKQKALIDEQVIYPQASSMIALAETSFEKQEWQSASEFAPLYIRNNVAKKPQQR